MNGDLTRLDLMVINKELSTFEVERKCSMVLLSRTLYLKINDGPKN